MGKKRNSKKKINLEETQEFENSLPQNIVKFGEHVEEDKNIYISQKTYKQIHKFTEDKTVVESGGVLLGKVIEEFGKTNIIISAFVEAKYSTGTDTTLTFTHESWEYIHKEADKKYPDLKIVGWIHTHPNFGIFLSEYDKFIQQNFFSEENQVAYVVDPIQEIEGFYFWINEKIERCKGFYVYDKNGVKITVSEKEADSDSEEDKEEKQSFFAKNKTTLVAILLMISLAFNIFFVIKLNGYKTEITNLNTEVSELKEVIQTYVASALSAVDSSEETTVEGETTTKAETKTTTTETTTAVSTTTGSTKVVLTNSKNAK